MMDKLLCQVYCQLIKTVLETLTVASYSSVREPRFIQNALKMATTLVNLLHKQTHSTRKENRRRHRTVVRLCFSVVAHLTPHLPLRSHFFLVLPFTCPLSLHQFFCCFIFAIGSSCPPSFAALPSSFQEEMRPLLFKLSLFG